MARKRKPKKRKRGIAHHVKKHALPITAAFITWLLPSPLSK